MKKIKSRKLNRLKNYDYSVNGYYYLTICAHDRWPYFGKIINHEMILNNNGNIANNYLLKINEKFSHVELDEFIIMPNHIHLIINIVGKVNIVGNAYTRSLRVPLNLKNGQYDYNRTRMLIPLIIQWYKSMVSKKINSQNNNYYFRWQKSYYDRVIRNDDELNNIRHYIQLNPKNWEHDRNFHR